MILYTQFMNYYYCSKISTRNVCVYIFEQWIVHEVCVYNNTKYVYLITHTN